MSLSAVSWIHLLTFIKNPSVLSGRLAFIAEQANADCSEIVAQTQINQAPATGYQLQFADVLNSSLVRFNHAYSNTHSPYCLCRYTLHLSHSKSELKDLPTLLAPLLLDLPPAQVLLRLPHLAPTTVHPASRHPWVSALQPLVPCLALSQPRSANCFNFL